MEEEEVDFGSWDHSPEPTKATEAQASATTIARTIYDWAYRRGALVSSRNVTAQPTNLLAHFDPKYRELYPLTDEILHRLRVVAVTADDAAQRVTVLLKLKVAGSAVDGLPRKIGNVTVAYIGQTDIPTVPPYVPLTSAIGGARFHIHQNRFTCGNSITASPVPAAGTLGALIRLNDGTLCGLTNNHVTGDCNHTIENMYVLCPAPMDADPDLPPPTAIGKHHSLILLNSGHPTQVVRQEFDVALFKILDENLVTSLQGIYYDTPAVSTLPFAGMRVKKVGRTSGATFGTVLGPLASPLVIPYQAANFRSTVHFQGAWAVRGSGADNFSEGGDSGSLVVTDDGKAAVGLIFAGGSGISLMMLIQNILDNVGGSLIGGLNV